MKHNVLLIGSGGREHAMTWRIAQSPSCGELFVAPGNAGTSSLATNVNLDISNLQAVKAFCLERAIDLVVVGPEQPLVDGIVDFIRSEEELQQIAVVGLQEQNALQLILYRSKIYTQPKVFFFLFCEKWFVHLPTPFF